MQDLVDAIVAMVEKLLSKARHELSMLEQPVPVRFEDAAQTLAPPSAP